MKTSERWTITLSLVQQLIEEQFPEFKNLEIHKVKNNGWDHTTFHLGKKMLIRMPNAECYVASIQKEQKWLKVFKDFLSLLIPTPVGVGKPSVLFPWNWSIYEWISGNSANETTLNEQLLEKIAFQLAKFLNELHQIPIKDGPKPGAHNFWRGGTLSVYDEEVQTALKNPKITQLVNPQQIQKIWKRALSSVWKNDPVWVHGDLAVGNFLIKNEEMVAIIDFEGLAIGDPACDLVIAWTLFSQKSQKIFQEKLEKIDAETWIRAKGWALWKALMTIEQTKNDWKIKKQQKMIVEILNSKI